MAAVVQLANGALHAQGCLFCRSTDRGFVAEEHIFSYALGNRGEFVLPPGVVCDPCNNNRLAPAEHAFTSFEPIEMLLAERGIGTRKKKGIVSRWNGAQVWWTAPGEMNVASAREEVVSWDAPDGGKLALRGRKVLTTRFFEQVARVIWKTALEFVYLDHGPVLAFEPKFDPVREMVAGQREARGWVVAPSHGRAHQNVQLKYELGRTEPVKLGETLRVVN